MIYAQMPGPKYFKFIDLNFKFKALARNSPISFLSSNKASVNESKHAFAILCLSLAEDACSGDSLPSGSYCSIKAECWICNINQERMNKLFPKSNDDSSIFMSFCICSVTLRPVFFCLFYSTLIWKFNSKERISPQADFLIISLCNLNLICLATLFIFKQKELIFCASIYFSNFAFRNQRINEAAQFSLELAVATKTIVFLILQIKRTLVSSTCQS